MKCINPDRVKPLDELLENITEEYESGRDRVCGKDLDTMIWELGDYENEEPIQEADEYAEETPIEDVLAEKTMTVSRRGRVTLSEVPDKEEAFFTGETLATASAIGRETRTKRTTSIRQTAVAKGAKAKKKAAGAPARTPAKKKKMTASPAGRTGH
jgi:hypothetical protein